jgi:hypothetical protein
MNGLLEKLPYAFYKRMGRIGTERARTRRSKRGYLRSELTGVAIIPKLNENQMKNEKKERPGPMIFTAPSHPGPVPGSVQA